MTIGRVSDPESFKGLQLGPKQALLRRRPRGWQGGKGSGAA